MRARGHEVPFAGAPMQIDVTAVIPARLGSTRLPAKALLSETGRFLVQHVYEQVRRARRIGRVLVATDDQRIIDAVGSFGGEAMMTRPDHQSGTDRVAEVAERLGGRDDDVYVNVQGDEPEIDPAALDQLVDRMLRDGPSSRMGTLATPFPGGLDPRAPSAVKVVLSSDLRALYFSRALIPYPRDGAAGDRPPVCFLHLGVYAYRRRFLLELSTWPPGRLEQVEKLEQLRVLERGHPIAVEIVKHASCGIDTPEDYARFVQRWKERSG